MVKKLPVTVRPVEDARRRDVCPDTFRDPADTFPLTVAEDAVSAVAVVVASVEVPVTERVPPILVLPDVEMFVVEAFPSIVCPVTVSELAVVLPVVEVPEMSVENVPVVNVGLEVMLIVEVPEKMTLAPAIKYETGVL